MAGDIPMSVRRLIADVDVKKLNVTKFCKEHGIGRSSFYEIRKRVDVEGESGLELRSRAPDTVANKTPVVVEDRIVELRKSLADDGLDNGAATIWWHLTEEECEQVPSESTIWRILTRRGFVTPDPTKSRRVYKRFEAGRANEMWQIDGTDHTLRNGKVVKIINVIDDGSRVLAGARAHPTESKTAAFDALCVGATVWGWPQIVLSDNGKGLTALKPALAVLGVTKIESSPYHPQTCGKVERFHRTQQKWLASQPAAESIEELQILLDEFTIIYNEQRPHRSVGRRPPVKRWNALPKSGPANQPLNIDTTNIVDRRVARNGAVAANQKLISVGSRLAGETVTVITTGLTCHIFHKGDLIRTLTIDPDKRVQPIYDRPGAPRRTK
jgi:transposase InsO family protein